ncbi:MAG TPA: DUF4011 domain-containing protein, partial [Armatimonadaceae bacterium]|nr:DUF4011 domain-containing protein [Armatimonadaceae bacterium]
MSFAETPERIQSTVESWKSSLLDLSPRNPLVALPPTGVIELAAPNDLFDILIRRRKPLQFWDLANREMDRNVLREPGNYPARAAMMESLRHLHLQAVALLQGQDINVLYVSFGTLTWRHPDSGEAVRSPLLIVPVTLEPHPASTGFTLQAMEEPVEVNPVLKLRLAREDLGFALPNAPDERYLVPSAYLSTVAGLVEGREGWEVQEVSSLAKLPLIKLRLFEDLLAQEDQALRHPLVAALSGLREAIESLPAVPVPALSALDQSDFVEGEYQMLDADPAQQRAVVAAARGQNLVLQGPPGTGKTQTITNIIGECIASGKSVLLVSGRMASLDAVYQRLTDRGLGDLCLLAHSLKTSKRDILQQLDQAIAAPRSAGAAGSAAARAARLKEREETAGLRARLNALASEMHRTREPLGITPYEAVGILAENLISGVPAGFSFALDSPESVSAERYAAMDAQAMALAKGDALASPGENAVVWAGAFADTTRPNLAREVQQALETLIERTDRLNKAAAAAAPLCAQDESPADVARSEWLLRLMGDLASLETPLPRNWLTTDSPAALRDHLIDFRNRYEAFQAERAAVTESFDDSVLALPHADLRQRLEARGEAPLEPLLGPDWRERAAAEFETWDALLEAIRARSHDLHEKLTLLSDKSGVPLDESPEGRVLLLRVLQRAIDLPNPCVGWFAPGVSDRLSKLLAEGWDRWSQYRKKSRGLFEAYTEEVLNLDFDALLPNLVTPKTGIARLLSPAVARDQKAVRAVLKPHVQIKDRDFNRDFALAKEVRELKLWCDQNAERLSNAFGPYYKREETDWEGLRDLLNKAKMLAAEFGSGHVPPVLVKVMLHADTDLKEVAEAHAETSRILTELRDVWEQLALQSATPEAIPAPQTPLPEIAEWSAGQHEALAEYHEAYRLLRAAVRRGGDAPSVSESIRALGTLERVSAQEASFQNESEAMRPLYGSAYRGLETDWDALELLLERAGAIRRHFEDRPLPERLAAALTAGTDSARAAALRETKDAFAAALSDFRAAGPGLLSVFREEYLRVGDTPLTALPFPAVEEWAFARLGAVDSVADGMTVHATRDDCAAVGLTGFFDAALEQGVSGEALPAAFRVGFHRAWLNAVLAGLPGLADFSAAEHDRGIARFRALDRKLMETVPAQIREITRGRSPKQYPDEIKTLKGQLARRRTGEVRHLLAEIPNLLFALKPIVMMNPLSVRLFLDADAVQFDVIVFDDASQIATEEAIGAVLRGRQVIIAGDPKQIPPITVLSDNERPFESILDRASAVADRDSAHFGLHALNWHYRSRNESLIAFSRRYFYPELVAFPAATVGSAVRYERLPDTEPAVIAIVDRVLEYTRENPRHTLGVIVLDDMECESVLREIDRRREADPDIVLPREAEGGEGFFVKTIENVQGDERDMILVYLGGDPNRCVPLTVPGGERLLNVATTRARDRMLVMDALTPAAAAVGQVDGGEAPGVRFLRAFVEFARVGVDSGDAEDEALPQGRFERCVEQALTERGYTVRHRVGQSDYRVDLAVVDPRDETRYLLGIECDSAAYASAETARHRDRLRAEMLTERGWRLHRIWSLEWARDPEGQSRALEAALKAALSAAPGSGGSEVGGGGASGNGIRSRAGGGGSNGRGKAKSAVGGSGTAPSGPGAAEGATSRCGSGGN